MPDAGEIKTNIEQIINEMTAEATRLIEDKMSGLHKLIEAFSGSDQPVSAPSGDKPVDLSGLKQASYTLQNAAGQAEIISAILNFAGTCVQRAAVFAFKNKKLYGWQAVGLNKDKPSDIVSIKKMVLDVKQPSPFQDILKKKKPWKGPPPENPFLDDVFKQFGGPVPQEMCLYPLSIKDRIIAVLYGDSITGDQELFQTDSLEIMAVIASLVMENVSISRSKGSPGQEPEAKTKDDREVSTRPVKAAPLPEDMDEETRKQHEKAKRTARVIVGDIALYNKAKIEQGLSSGNLGELLKEDISKGRELYNQRVSSDITESSNYFEETLIEMIAKGNRNALGI